MATFIKKLDFQRKEGKLYAVNKKKQLLETTPKKKGSKVIMKLDFDYEPGYLYFVDRKNNLYKAKLKNQKR